jgi:hypothetical protein
MADGLICEVFSGDEEPVDGFVIFSEESESQPTVPLGDGYDDYIRNLPEEIGVELCSALRVIDRDLSRAHTEIKRGYDIRFDLLSRCLQFIEANGRNSGTPFYFDPTTLAFLGELAKCEEMRLQMARLIDQGDAFSAVIGLIYEEGYFPLLYAFDPELNEVKPYEILFPSRINDCICRHNTETVFYPCREENLASRLSCGLAQEIRLLTLMNSKGDGSAWVLCRAGRGRVRRCHRTNPRPLTQNFPVIAQGIRSFPSHPIRVIVSCNR